MSAPSKIAQGLAAAEKGERSLAEARGNADVIIREARERATQIIDQAHHRANEIVEEAKGTASTEGARLVAAAHQQIELDSDARRARACGARSAGIAVGAASKLLGARDRRAHARRSARQARDADLRTQLAMADKLTIARPYAQRSLRRGPR